MPVGNAALCEVVWREFDIHAVAHENTDAVATHSARDGGEHHVISVRDLDLKIGVWLFIDDRSGHFDQFFFHKVEFCLITIIASG